MNKKQKDLPINAVDINDDLLWSKIEKELDKKKRRRFVFILFFFAVLGSTMLWNYFIPGSKGQLKPMPVMAREAEFLKKNEKSEGIRRPLSFIKNESNRPSDKKVSNEVRKENSINIAPQQPPINYTAEVKKHVISQEPGIKNDNDLKNTEPSFNYLALNSIQKGEKFIRRVSETAQLSLLTFNVLPSRVNRIEMDMEVSENKIKKIEREIGGYTLSFFSGVGLVSKTNTFDSEQDWQTLKNSKEKPIFTSYLAIAIRKEITSKLFVSLGLAKENTFYDFTGNQVTISKSEIASDSARYLKLGEQIVYLEGTRVVTKTKTDHYNVVNKNEVISLPVEIGYKLWSNTRQLELSIGSSLILSNKLKGYTYIEKSGISSYDQLGKALKFNKGFSDLMLQMNYRFPILKGIHLSLGLRGVLPLQSYYTINYYDQRAYESKNYKWYGNIGFSYLIH